MTPVEEFKPHKWQYEVLRAFDAKLARFFMLCWHRRARKTTLLLNLLLRECVDNENSVYGYIGPTITQAKAIIWRDPNMLNKYLPRDEIKRINESELFVEFKNNSVFRIEGADRVDRLRGPDWRGVALDEWALMKREIWEEILRPVIAQASDRWAMFAFTPKGVNHAYEYWNKCASWKEWYKSLLPVSESNLIPIEQLKQARIEMSDVLYDQELECSFIAREEKSLITTEMIEALLGVELFPAETKHLIACDPSEGGDECVIQVFENEKVVEQVILHENNTMIISGNIQNLGFKYGTKNYAGDSIGCGKGIADDLQLKGWDVQAINSAESAFENTRFYNKRTELWWNASELIRSRLVYPITDEELKRQLVAPKYEVIDSNGKIRLEPKKYTKELLGRSPDRADCFIYGLWGLRNITDKMSETKKPYRAQVYKYNPSVYHRRKLVYCGG